MRNGDVQNPRCRKREAGTKFLQSYGWCIGSALANLRMWDTDLIKKFSSCSRQVRPIFDIVRAAGCQTVSGTSSLPS